MVPSGSCQRRFQPPLHIQHYPPLLVRGVGLDRLDHQVMINGIEEFLDVKIEHPVLLLAPQAAFRERVQRAAPGPVPVRVLMENGLRAGLQRHRRYCLRDAIRHSWHPEDSHPAAMRLGDFHRSHRGREVRP